MPRTQSRVLTVTTNATGRAVATGLTPTGPGSLQIAAGAVYQGQTAALTAIGVTSSGATQMAVTLR